MSRARLDKQPREVAEMFDGVAGRYDLVNRLLSFGQDQAWRRATRRALALAPGQLVLDLGAGTGVSTVEIGRSGARAVGVDISLGMLAAGQRKRPATWLLAGDALRLPFPDQTFDAVTISFALRNLHDSGLGLREMARITKPGGRLVVCEFSWPVNNLFRHIYFAYLVAALPKVAAVMSSNPAAYQYLAESIGAWPDQATLAGEIAANGWSTVQWRNLSGGIVALHRAIRR